MKWIKTAVLLSIMILSNSCDFFYHQEDAPEPRSNKYLTLTNNFEETMCIYSIVANENDIWQNVRFDCWLSKIVPSHGSSLEKRYLSVPDIEDPRRYYNYPNRGEGYYQFIAIKLSTVLNSTPEDIEAAKMYDCILSYTHQEMEEMKWVVTIGPKIE